jgi:hypothetical protein
MITVQVIGKTVDEAKALCESANMRLRITRTDGVAHIVTMDYRTDRVNVHVENGKVTKATIG